MKGELAIFLVKFGWNYGGGILTTRNGGSLVVRSVTTGAPPLSWTIVDDIDIHVYRSSLIS